MGRLKWMLVGGVIWAVSPAALAFQESQGGVATRQQEQPDAKIAPATPAPLDLKDTGVSVAPSTGVEVRIPGLGKLGVLPKFDFGLELLYGVNEKAEEAERQGQSLPGDDVQIRGSFKHRF
ncbi:MAG: hypothetical protein R3D44_14040 [Hyphomicrobiaceae bacterium]